ncbi:hypothetical protein Vadar_029795 [Vaccinium darrowii]|uniref:Uncharacterized protein n=1 Tax=Vaccinium darrowii TaxID=229202 RepID=A0ACB7YRS5_9ERIC|nr:hypothetical protein Vadar_029795 [Vaccinium darrowii]
MSSTSTNSRFQGPLCGCGVPAPLRSSNQDPNRGRRFFGCINYKQPTACGFFLWLDPERDMEKELLQVENQVLKREVDGSSVKVDAKDYEKEEWLVLDRVSVRCIRGMVPGIFPREMEWSFNYGRVLLATGSWNIDDINTF